MHRIDALEKFLSTLSVRRATTNGNKEAIMAKISIHALREESDTLGLSATLRCMDFYPRSP